MNILKYFGLKEKKNRLNTNKKNTWCYIRIYIISLTGKLYFSWLIKDISTYQCVINILQNVLPSRACRMFNGRLTTKMARTAFQSFVPWQSSWMIQFIFAPFLSKEHVSATKSNLINDKAQNDFVDISFRTRTE